MEEKKITIIGSGPAGLTAALYAARASLEPLLFEGSMPGGQLMGTTFIENWPGSARIAGPELMRAMKEHAKQFGAQLVQETVTSVDFSQEPFTITSKKRTVRSRAVIIATGATPKRLGCPGEDTYWGKGVATCAVCDGALYKHEPVMIVGGGDTALEDASFMTNFSNDITIVQIGPSLSGSAIMQKRVINHPSIKIIYRTTVTAIEGDGNHVTSVSLKHLDSGKEEKRAVKAIFLAIGSKPNSELFQGQLELRPSGHIITTHNSHTSRAGIFAAGDVIDPIYRQAIVSAGSGCMAALDAERFLK